MRINEEKGESLKHFKKWENEKGILYNKKTINKNPEPELIELVENIKPGKACELGPGSGNSTIFLLKKGWKVTDYDINQNSEECVKSRISNQEKERFNFVKTEFESIELEQENDLVIAFNSLPFCTKEYFNDFFEKIVSSIKPGGYLIGNLFGNKHSYNRPNSKMTFHTRKEVEDLLKKYFIVDFNNSKQFMEKEEKIRTLEGEGTPWHTFVFKVMKKI